MMNIGNCNQRLMPKSPTSNPKILIVDNELEVAISINKILNLEGLKATIVTGGIAATRELSTCGYDLVLLDLNMPDLDGEGVLDYINNNNITTNVIVISGASELKTAINVLKNGAKDFIRKPYAPEELLFSIQNVLDKNNLERENRLMMEKLGESDALHRFLVHNSPDLLFMLDHNGCFVFVNKNTTKSLGYSINEIIGKHYNTIVYAEDIKLADQFFNQSNTNKTLQSNELRLQGKEIDTLLYVEVRAVNIERKFSGNYKLSRDKHTKKNFFGTYGIARDISASKKAEETINFQFHHDLLTELPNRTLLNKRLTELISSSLKDNTKFALLFININRFKLVNDTYGRGIGDQLLQHLAQTLRSCTRDKDTLARMGCDEFVLLMDSIKTPEDTVAIANKIIAATAQPFKLTGIEIHTSISIGIAIYPENGETREVLLKNADTAGCSAKAKSHSSHCLYSPDLNNKHSNTVKVENLIRNAIKKDQFVIAYQPQVDPATGIVHAVEALVRIAKSDGTLILPGEFIDTAEETSLINEIGEIVLEKVFLDKQEWNQKNLPLQVCINISARQLAINNFAEHVLDKLRSYQINPPEIELEITENTLVKHMGITISNLVKLADAGVKIAIDDFGTGYSSLSYLNQLPLNTLKLDKSFINKITANNMEDNIIPAIINVANGLQLDFIAEGIETVAQHEYLLQQGSSCIAQGFYYSRPIDRAQLLKFITIHGIKSIS